MTDDAPVLVDEPRALRLASWTVLPLLGAGLGLLLSLLLPWLLGLPWLPFEGPLRLVERIPPPWGTVVPIAVGAAAGLALAVAWARERLVVAVGRDEVVLTRGDERHAVAGRDLGAVFRDGGGHLVLLGPDGAELAREQTDHGADRLRGAFERRGHPWRDGDPYEDAYALWVDDAAGLPPGADAVLRSRRRALAAEKGKDEAAAQRRELVRLGVVVRDEGENQYWRPAVQDRRPVDADGR